MFAARPFPIRKSLLRKPRARASGQVRWSGVSDLSESVDRGDSVGVRLVVDGGLLGGCLDGVCVVSVNGVGDNEESLTPVFVAGKARTDAPLPWIQSI